MAASVEQRLKALERSNASLRAYLILMLGITVASVLRPDLLQAYTGVSPPAAALPTDPLAGLSPPSAAERAAAAASAAAAAGSAGSGSGEAALATGKGATIEASMFKVVHPDTGDLMMAIGATESGESLVEIYDSEGAKRVKIVATPEVASIELHEAEAESPRAYLSVVDGESAGLGLVGFENDNRVEVYAAETGAAGLSLADKSGTFRTELSVSKDETAGVRFADKNKKMRTWLSVPAKGTVGLGLADKTGRPRGRFTIQENGYVILGLDDKNGKPRAEMFLTGKGSTGVDLYYKSGKRAVEMFTTLDSMAGMRMVDRYGNPHHWASVREGGVVGYLWSDPPKDDAPPTVLTFDDPNISQHVDQSV